MGKNIWEEFANYWRRRTKSEERAHQKTIERGAHLYRWLERIVPVTHLLNEECGDLEAEVVAAHVEAYRKEKRS